MINFDKDAHTVEFIAYFDDQSWKKKGKKDKKKESHYLHIDVDMDEEDYRGDENGKNGLWLGEPQTYRLGNTHAEREIGKPRDHNKEDDKFIEDFFDWIFGKDNSELIVSTATATTLLLLTVSIF